MTKTEREAWGEWVQEARRVKDTSHRDAVDDVIVAVDLHIRKLERELQALKHKKAVAAILQKKV